MIKIIENISCDLILFIVQNQQRDAVRHGIYFGVTSCVL